MLWEKSVQNSDTEVLFFSQTWNKSVLWFPLLDIFEYTQRSLKFSLGEAMLQNNSSMREQPQNDANSIKSSFIIVPFIGFGWAGWLRWGKQLKLSFFPVMICWKVFSVLLNIPNHQAWIVFQLCNLDYYLSVNDQCLLLSNQTILKRPQ